MKLLILLLALACTVPCAQAQDLDAKTRDRIDKEVRRVLSQTGVPSAEVGIARGGKIVYTVAFGQARISPSLPAAVAMRYPIGSVSKQFTAACVMLLVEDGKLSLDDHVSKWFPDYTEASKVTVRNLLTHTSGYSDYAPQDYTIPAWTRPTDHVALIHEWAAKPLDFEPGTRWQYSNTNFAIAGMIVEKAAGEPFWQFITRRILTPVGITQAIDLNLSRDLQVQGYMGNALGPQRITQLESPGWYFANGEMAMPIADLMRWDLALITRAPVLKPSSWDALETAMKLNDGTDTGYGLGIHVGSTEVRRAFSHSGEVGGYVSQNTVYPDDGLAIAALTNAEASSAASEIVTAIDHILLKPSPKIVSMTKVSETPEGAGQAETQALTILAGLMKHQIDRKLFTDDANFYFSDETIADFANSLGPLGPVVLLRNTASEHRGGMVFRIFSLQYGKKTLELTTYTEPDGKLEQFLVTAK